MTWNGEERRAVAFAQLEARVGMLEEKMIELMGHGGEDKGIVGNLDAKLDDIIAIKNQARGAIWLLFGIGSFALGVAAFLSNVGIQLRGLIR